MGRGSFIRGLLITALLVGVAGCGGGSGRNLQGSEIKTLFSGKTVKGRHDKRGYAFKSFYETDGTFRSYQGGAKEPRKAKWRVSGDQICVTWEDTNEDLCRTMVTDDKGSYWKVKVKRNGAHVRVVTFDSFSDGNSEKL